MVFLSKEKEYEKKQAVLLFHILMSSNAVLELDCICFQGSFGWFRINSCWINIFFIWEWGIFSLTKLIYFYENAKF